MDSSSPRLYLDSSYRRRCVPELRDLRKSGSKKWKVKESQGNVGSVGQSHALRVQVPNNHILTQTHVPNYWVHGPSGFCTNAWGVSHDKGPASKAFE